MTTTINNEHKKLNVPNLRFKEFEGEWSVTTLQKDCIVNPTNEKIADKFVYVDLESVKQGQLYKYQILTKDNAPSRAQRVLHTDDILFQCVRPYQMNNYMVKGTMSDIQWVASTGYAQIRTQTDYPAFLYYVLNTSKYNKAVMVRCTGSSYPAINSEDLSKIPFYKCGIAEQKKIADFLSLLDERIATQNKVIEDLKKLKSAIIDYVINSLNTDFAKFGSLYEMAGEGGTPTTSNASFYDNGKIPFIKIDDLKKKYLTENKDFITELGLQKSSAWLVPTHSILFSNGATIGEISITTYPVCTKQGILGIVPKQNIDVEFLYYFMSSSYFKKAVSRIVTEGTMKTAYLKDINNILCPIPTKEKQQEIAKIPSALNSKIDFEQSILKLFKFIYHEERHRNSCKVWCSILYSSCYGNRHVIFNTKYE